MSLRQEFIVRGKLIYEGIGLPKAECVANACRIKGSDGSSSGDWMVVTELRKIRHGQFEETEKRSPSEVEKSARAIVDKVNVPKLEITIKVVSVGHGARAANTALGTTSQPPTPRKPRASLCSSSKQADTISLTNSPTTSSLTAQPNALITQPTTSYTAYSQIIWRAKPVAQHTPHCRQASSRTFLKWIERRSIPPSLNRNASLNRCIAKNPSSCYKVHRVQAKPKPSN